MKTFLCAEEVPIVFKLSGLYSQIEVGNVVICWGVSEKTYQPSGLGICGMEVHNPIITFSFSSGYRTLPRNIKFVLLQPEKCIPKHHHSGRVREWALTCCVRIGDSNILIFINYFYYLINYFILHAYCNFPSLLFYPHPYLRSAPPQSIPPQYSLGKRRASHGHRQAALED